MSAPAQEVSSPSQVPISTEGHAYSPAHGESVSSSTVKEEDLKDDSSKKDSDVSDTVVKVEKSGVETSAEPSSDDSQPKISRLRKNLILVCLAGAQFFDIFNACAAIVALPAVRITYLFFCSCMHIETPYLARSRSRVLS